MRCSSCKFKTIYFISNLFRSAIWFYGFDFNSRFYTWCLLPSYDRHSNIYYWKIHSSEILCSEYMIFFWCYNRQTLIIFIKLTLKCFFQSGGEDEAMSDNEFSRDGDSPDALSRVPPTDVDPETLEKLRQQVTDYYS